jgi:hypothetical protein
MDCYIFLACGTDLSQRIGMKASVWHTLLFFKQQKYNGQRDWQRVGSEWVAHLVDLSVCSISNNFNELEDSSWVLGRKKLWAIRKSDMTAFIVHKTVLFYLESIKINFIQWTIDIKRSVRHFWRLRVKVGEENLLPPTEWLWQCFFFALVCGHSLRIEWASGTQLKSKSVGSTHTNSVWNGTMALIIDEYNLYP